MSRLFLYFHDSHGFDFTLSSSLDSLLSLSKLIELIHFYSPTEKKIRIEGLVICFQMEQT